jgi:hypothetical protein
MIMTTTKTLLLAGFAALSLGVGAAQAQSLVPSSNESAFFRAQKAPVTVNQDDQSGSSDISPNQTAGTHDAATILNNHLYGAGGFSG